MKLLVLSDSHRNMDRMRIAVEETNPDAILHLGDHIDDAQKLNQEYPDAVFYMLRGNCDYSNIGKTEMFLTISGVKVFMAHGHTYGVKASLDNFVNEARRLEADVALYGHTHSASVQREFGMWFMCPGQLERNNRIHFASYGIVTIENAMVNCEVIRVSS